MFICVWLFVFIRTFIKLNLYFVRSPTLFRRNGGKLQTYVVSANKLTGTRTNNRSIISQKRRSKLFPCGSAPHLSPQEISIWRDLVVYLRKKHRRCKLSPRNCFFFIHIVARRWRSVMSSKEKVKKPRERERKKTNKNSYCHFHKRAVKIYGRHDGLYRSSICKNRS